MEFSPIILFVYNRSEQTKIVLQTLSCCQYADKSELYIFADAAKNESALEQVNAVRKIIEDTAWKEKFKKVNIIKAEKNKGLANSVISGVSTVIGQHGRVIVVEDDNRVAEDFLDYMNRGLDFYCENMRVGMIGGYTVPIKFPTGYDKDVFGMGRGSSYAWATWKNRWEKVDWEVKDYEDFRKDRLARKRFAEYGADRLGMLDNQVRYGMNSWAIRFSYAMFKNDWIAILPTKTRVENIGFDGSGVHNVAGVSEFNVSIETNLHPVRFENVDINPEIKKEFVKLFDVPMSLKIKRYLNRWKRNLGGRS